jgi:hypothetical protein
MKSKIFIGSTLEGIKLANAVKTNFEHDAYADVWNNGGIFSLSGNTLDDLLLHLDEYDYAIFIFQPDDKTAIRGKNYNTVRDNVIFELGLFFGKLGKNRAFYIIPRNYPKIRIPTDLYGVTAGTYDYERLMQQPDKIESIVATFCNQIKFQIKNNPVNQGIGIKESKMFNNFTEDFEKLINQAKNITLFFIHSRQWRENNDNVLRDFLKRSSTKLNVILPNLQNTKLIDRIKNNFSDGEVIEPLIKDAYSFFEKLKSQYTNVEIRSFDSYPTYSFYCFDNEAIIALYSTTPKKKNVPSFKITKDSKFWQFLYDDVQELMKSKEY